VPSITITGIVICVVALELFVLSAAEVAVMVTLPPVGRDNGAV